MTTRQESAEKQKLIDELNTAFDKASQNATDLAAQKAFRQKFKECRDFVEHQAA